MIKGTMSLARHSLNISRRPTRPLPFWKGCIFSNRTWKSRMSSSDFLRRWWYSPSRAFYLPTRTVVACCALRNAVLLGKLYDWYILHVFVYRQVFIPFFAAKILLFADTGKKNHEFREGLARRPKGKSISRIFSCALQGFFQPQISQISQIFSCALLLHLTDF